MAFMIFFSRTGTRGGFYNIFTIFYSRTGTRGGVKIFLLFFSVGQGQGVAFTIFLLFFFSRAGTRSGNVAGYARSEAELEQIMDGLHEQEVSFYFFSTQF